MNAPIEPDDDAIPDWVYPSTDTGNPPKLRDRQLLFLKHYMDTGNLVASMKSAGYAGDDDTLRANGYHVRARLRRAVPALMRANDITVNDLLTAFREALQATKVTRVKVKEVVTVTDADGKETSTVQDVIQTFQDIDFATRLKAAEIGARIFGLLDRAAPGLNVLMGQPHDQGTLAAGFVGMDAEADADMAEQEAVQTVSEAELRSDINEIQRKLRLIGYELRPVPPVGGVTILPPEAPVPGTTTPQNAQFQSNTSSQNRMEKPKP